MKFGYSETIRTTEFDKAHAEKTAFRFDTPKSHVVKDADSFIISSEPEALGHIISAVKQLTADSSDYTCIELFTDKDGLTRINICHMKETI